MSKSKNNGVDPQALIEQYGADTARFFMMFTSPPEQTLEWSDAGVEGSSRFLQARVERSRTTFAAPRRGIEAADGAYAQYAYPAEWRGKHPRSPRRGARSTPTLKQANYDIARHQFNTVASAAMKMLNALERRAAHRAMPRRLPCRCCTKGSRSCCALLSPITPHIAHRLWRELGYGGDIRGRRLARGRRGGARVQDEIELVLQVNGKLRGHVRVPPRPTDKAAIEQLALATRRGREVHRRPGRRRRSIVVPGRLVNVVV